MTKEDTYNVDPLVFDSVASSEATPEEKAIARELATLAYQHLPLIEARAWFLRYYLDETYEVIAHDLNCTRKTASLTVRNANTKMRALADTLRKETDQ